MADHEPPDPLQLLSSDSSIQQIYENPSTSRTIQKLYVSPPRLTQEEKIQYSDIPEEGLFSEPELVVDEIVGEFRDEKNGLFYYARREQELLRSYPAKVLEKHHKHLIESYDYKRKHRLVPEKFDPSSQEVEPGSRIRIHLKVNRRRSKAEVSYRSGSESVFAESDDSPESTDTEDDEYGAVITHRKSSRLPPTRPPFSPKKTRSRGIRPILEDDDSDSEAAHKRRVTRSKKGRRIDYDVGLESDQIQASDSQVSSRTRGNKKTKTKKTYSAGARPAYGHFRSMDDIGYDPDEETRALRAHRRFCEKCHKAPATVLLQLALKNAKKGKRKKHAESDNSEDSQDEKEAAIEKGGWVQCLKCPVAAHWKCLAGTQRDEILRATRQRDREAWLKQHEGQEVDVAKDGPRKRPTLECDQTTEFICGSCLKGGICMGCMEIALDPNSVNAPAPQKSNTDGPAATDEDGEKEVSLDPKQPSQLLFRCLTCKRLGHYAHLALPDSLENEVETAERLQDSDWLCNDCLSYQWSLDKILAWRPYPPNSVEPPRTEPVHYKSSLPREYLIKWLDRSYRRLTWVPHMWLLSTHPSKLKNFLTSGSKVELLDGAERKDFDDRPSDIFDDTDVQDSLPRTDETPSDAAPSAMPDAEARIPLEWKTADRVLSVLLRRPHPRKVSRSSKGRKGRQTRTIISDDEGNDEEAEDVYKAMFDAGEMPPQGFTESVPAFEARMKRKFGEESEDIDLVVWAFMKWVDLGYDQATWDTPPKRSDPTYTAFEIAFRRFVSAREVTVVKHKKGAITALDKRTKGEYRRKLMFKDPSEIQLGQDPKLKLMPFQLDGFNWLCDNWWNKQACILADDMGLGKTVQVASFIGRAIGEFGAQPALVIVPNSTITNWVREFERWAPNLRVVPFYGETKSREVVKEFELFHDDVEPGTTGAKFHVLVTTFEAVINPRDFTSVFKAQPRWEILVVDEGQRLKSDSSLLFRKLNELKTLHRVIMTGTPLNNNMRELFNLMNFLDPSEWQDLDALEREHEELTEELVKQLHNRLRPYFLRRIKSDVLDLPPKNEVIVPVSMTKLQKELYRSILSRNLDLLAGLTKPGTQVQTSARKSKITNMLMELRKCLQHPYLCDEGIEPRGLSLQETHEKLIDASAKLRLLKNLLPKLKARGHRVLLFSQFVIALNIVEDFLVGEGYKFLRLDGNTPGFKRQKDMDEFNRPGSDTFIYLLTTRAGGVGINLYTADTVVIFDPDFNPHQDLQAIARSHRFGQTKTCLVFKLMVKESAEERIMQMGKKKLVLDHLIVQKINDEESAGENVQSILMYGAQALFESDEGSAKDITYTDNDIDSLIQRTETEGDADDSARKESSGTFSFAKIWTADKDELEEIEDEDQAQGDSWAQTLQKINTEREKLKIQEEALSGRGVRRKAAMQKQNVYIEDTPIKKNKKNKFRTISDGESAYQGSGTDSEDNSTSTQLSGPENQRDPSTKQGNTMIVNGRLTVDIVTQKSTSGPACGLCNQQHGEGQCSMTESSENLVEYREMLLLHADDEPWETRSAAVKAIDEILHRRGQLHLIVGQPLYLVKKLVPAGNVKRENQKNTYQPPAVSNPQNSDAPSQAPRPGIQPTGLPKSRLPNNALHSMPKHPLSAQPVAGSSQIATSQTAPNYSVQLTAGPSRVPDAPTPIQISAKRPPSPNSLIPTGKKARKGEDCAVCGMPLHTLGECPVINEGPERVELEIKRFERLGLTHWVQVLRSVHSQQVAKRTKTLNRS
ncbi:hypothetical protein K435DRAFT_744240 [Dendrothele bispora CBS 962.96]|uniref:Chromatin remodeling factor mit1 n=1 Tax=Dendrothele bispora (strain CBS 962.96) TaxID=1314807 RepID=A0A4S8MS83_DENBC|nr:hypothetical protein K435DRAFT_744240 [Dendrothele bispora CBS 962.96]